MYHACTHGTLPNNVLTFSAKNDAIARSPGHCICSVGPCSTRKLGSAMMGASARPLKAMCAMLIAIGKRKP